MNDMHHTPISLTVRQYYIYTSLRYLAKDRLLFCIAIVYILATQWLVFPLNTS